MKIMNLLNSKIAPLFISVLFISVVFPYVHLDEETMVGTVVVLEKNEEDLVTAVGINVTVEVEEEQGFYEINEIYRIENNEIGQELLKLIGETIQVTGITTVSEDGENRINIKSYIILEDEDENQ